MPGIHRDNDSRFCSGKTGVSGQSTVYVNGKLCAVVGDEVVSHGGGAPLVAVYGSTNVYVEGKNVIVAVGDEATGTDGAAHSGSDIYPSESSDDVFCY